MQTFLTQDGKIIMASQTAAVKVRQDTDSDSPQPGQGDFSLAIRPTIAGSEAQSKVDLCVYVDRLMSNAPEHAHASDACRPVPGTFDMPHEVLDTGQALVLTRRRRTPRKRASW
ncbi:hypothetical protein [Paraburkholderia aspalathi]|uniref:hypothetical protein n=1 Tax=Paraburkholderia aspalathi TaxID=1324617 RepID=UPI0038B6F6E6